jgi:hypothetical protein
MTSTSPSRRTPTVLSTSWLASLVGLCCAEQLVESPISSGHELSCRSLTDHSRPETGALEPAASQFQKSSPVKNLLSPTRKEAFTPPGEELRPRAHPSPGSGRTRAPSLKLRVRRWRYVSGWSCFCSHIGHHDVTSSPRPLKNSKSLRISKRIFSVTGLIGSFITRGLLCTSSTRDSRGCLAAPCCGLCSHQKLGARPALQIDRYVWSTVRRERTGDTYRARARRSIILLAS